MLNAGTRSRLALEPPRAFAGLSRNLREDLQSDDASELEIAREVDLAHAARAEERLQLVAADA
jgi:hypothetical protein